MGKHHLHSSKRKPSSSSSTHKKKKKMKRSQDGSKKRSSRDKSKKLHRKRHSVAHSDDDDSYSSLPDSFSDDDRDRGRKRVRSGSRKDSKAHRKRIEISPSTSGKSQEDDSPRERKQKRSRRSSKSNVRKQRDKKSRREPSLGSSPSRCSTGSYSKGTERKLERNALCPDRTMRDKRNPGEHRSRNQRIKSRSESDSLFSRSDSDSHQSRQTTKNEYHPKSLRSVITVKDKEEELGGIEYDRFVYKDEIVYEHDDYPTPRGNESHGGVSRREALQHDSQFRFGSLEGGNEGTVASNVRNDNLSHNSEVRREMLDGETDIVSFDGVSDSLKNYKIEVSTANDDSNVEDLEAVLRKRALENLKKYRGGFHADVKSPADEKDESDAVVRKSSALKTHPDQQMYDNKEANSQLAGLNSVSSVLEKTKVLDGKRNQSGFVKKDGIGPASTEKLAGTYPSGGAEAIVNHDKHTAPVGAASEKPKPGGRTFNKELHRKKMTMKEALTSKESVLNASPYLLSNETVGGSKTLPNDDEVVTEVKSNVAITEAWTSLYPGAGGQSSKVQQNDTDEESKFQHRTIYVDRGGETVQTSLKVYIPKTTPALARRKLKR